jgi:CBS domain-containing protein
MNLDVLGDVRLRAVMTTDPAIAPAGWSVTDFLRLIARYAPHHVYPVLDRAGRPLGVLTLDRLESVSRSAQGELRIAQIAEPLERCVVADVDERLADLLTRAGALREDAAVIVLDNGRVAGLLSPRDLERFTRIADLLGEPPHVGDVWHREARADLR